MLMRCFGEQDAKGDDRRATPRGFMIQTTSHRILMRPAEVAVVTAVAAATVAVAVAAVVVVVAGSGLHRCEDIPLAQESPTPDWSY
jgi:hypothetical protein